MTTVTQKDLANVLVRAAARCPNNPAKGEQCRYLAHLWLQTGEAQELYQDLLLASDVTLTEREASDFIESALHLINHQAEKAV